MTRREWLTAAAGAAVMLGQKRKAGVGLQIYTVRNQMAKDPDGTLKAVAAAGYRTVETGREQAIELAPILKKYSLTTPSVSLDTPFITGNWKAWNLKESSLDAALEQFKKAGAKYAMVPYMLPVERKEYEKMAASLNAVGEKCRSVGVTLCYHNHAFEFGGEAGKRPIDILLSKTDPKYVGFEVDVFWVSITGNDPVEFLKANKGRVKLVHLKDKLKGAPVQLNEVVKPDVFKEVGNGTLDFKAILKAAAEAGAEHYFVEQDQSPDPLASIKQSYDYLRSLNAPELAL